MPRILGVNGSLRDASNTSTLVNLALEAARDCGAETILLDLREVPLPMYEAHRDYDPDPNVGKILQAAAEADGFIIGSPEYHGCMSGATKNFFDYLYREISGKLFGLVAATGGSQGNGCFDNMRAAVQYCHGWVLPYNISATGRDFDEEGRLINAKVFDRLQRMGRDLTIYAPVLYDRFKSDIAQPPEEKRGFAHWLS